METPFPGMDPYLEHPALWPGVQTRLIVALANQLGPKIRPRYVASVEDRVFIEILGQQLEVREHYIVILDGYRDFGVVTVIELVSPSNKAAGAGRDSYLAKQKEIRGSECHLVEIDLLRRGSHVMSVPLADPDPDAPLALQRALEQVYLDADYMLRVLYDEPCKPPLSPQDQEWASAQWQVYRRAHPELFPDANGR